MAQIVKKFIQDNAVSGAKIRLDNNEVLRARNAANTTDVSIVRVNLSDVPEFQVLPEVATGLPVPTSPKQLATIEYITNYVQGKIDAKDSVSYLLDANLTGGVFTAGNASTPSTITGVVALVIDGKTFSGADVTTPPIRVALTGQTAGLQNGIYNLTAATASTYTLTRASDFDGLANGGGTEVTSGAYFRVIAGTSFTGYEVVLTTVDPITVNTTALTFVKYPSSITIVGGDMVTATGSNIAIDLQTNSGLESSNQGNDAGQLRIKVDGATLEKDKTTAINTGNGSLISRKSGKQLYTLTAQDITNQYLDLSFVAGQSSADVNVVGGGSQIENLDYNINYTGGTSSKSRITFANGLASGGVSALAAGDAVEIRYTYLTL